jgi:hypothetical protein
MKRFQDLWHTANQVCNPFTSLQYCNAIYTGNSNEIKKSARDFMLWIWETTDTNFALIANNNQ